MTRPLVLLTGGSGFIASHILNTLLDRNYDVVITVRSEEKGRQVLNACPIPKERLSYFVAADIAHESAFDAVLQAHPSVQYVIHTASPYHFNVTDPVQDFIVPAVNGTTGILRSITAYAPNVKRVVITSSSAAILNPSNHAKVYNESIWGETSWEEAQDPRKAYRASKIYAERAAWDFVRNRQTSFDLVVLNPPLVFGPAPPHLASLDELNTSNHRIRDMLLGKFREGIPPTGPVYIFADVRDVAEAHVRAIEVVESGGRRFFTVGGFFSNKRIADVLREVCPDAEGRLPRDIPDDLPADVYGYDNSKSREVLGLEYRDLKTCVRDTVQSLMRLLG